MKNGIFSVSLHRERSGWSAGYTNPQGGGGNAMTYSGGSKKSALAAGLRMVTEGAPFVVLQENHMIAQGVKGGVCKHGTHDAGFAQANPRGCYYCIQAEAEMLLKKKGKVS